MLTKENVRITNLLEPAEDESASLSPTDKIESILRDKNFLENPPNSLAIAWKNFDRISHLIENSSEEILAQFFSCKNRESLTSLAGSLLTLSRNDPVLLTSVRDLMSRLSELANSLNRLHEARLIAAKFSDLFPLFRLIQIIETKINWKSFQFIYLLSKRKRDGKNSIPPTTSGKVVPGKAPPIPSLPLNLAAQPDQNFSQKITPSKISPKIAPPLPSFPVGKSAPFKGPPVPPPIVGGKISSPVIPSKAPPPVVGKAMPTIPSVAQIFSAPVFPVPSIGGIGIEFRKIHWQSIPVSRFEKSIFSQKIYGKKFEHSIDFDLIRAHFVREKNCEMTPKKSREPPTAAGTPVIGSSSPGAPQICLPSVLDQKRIQQIEIFLNRYRNLTRPFLESLVREGKSGDESLVDLIEAILALIPTPEETELLKISHEKSALESVPLPKADAFLFDLAIGIPEFKLAASSRIIVATFDTSFTEHFEYLKQFNRKCKEIFQCEILVEIFRIIGSIVVFLSGSNSFNGFGIDHLSSLKKIVSYKHKEYSAVHCLVEMLSESQWSDFTQLIDVSISGILEFDFDEVSLQVFELEKTIMNRLKKIEFKSKEFYREMIEEISMFITRVTPLLNSLTGEMNIAKSNAKTLREYFGENDKKSVNDIFIALRSFRNDLVTARTKSKKIREKQT